tara:strand:- start:310 stop:831 length:522 start_codon:yes stop_codon:yes gene_type:complete
MLTVWVPDTEGKEVFTAKTDSGYVGCVKTNECIFMTTKFFTKPLEAANAARKLKKQMKEKGTLTTPVNLISKKIIKEKTKVKSQVKLTGRLYTTSDTEAMPLLSFQEVWVITHPKGYVSDCLNKQKKRLVAFTNEREKAMRFQDHEEAKRIMRTLKGVVGPGFNLLRFFSKLK